ncbi:hypothetical protein EYZ11_012077 [Aspergillus tanneri]|uniref:Uncharacterized protein n=1 Tax=Aspergillus tanneri TaxID=1220188 RepID=A0A4S3J1G1_9EURO|nr:hypothetical protein EYZ11_012077 [Aspergillus tanneri]
MPSSPASTLRESGPWDHLRHLIEKAGVPFAECFRENILYAP